MDLSGVSSFGAIVLAGIAILVAAASYFGRAKDKATIAAYKENAAVQDRKIGNQDTTILEQGLTIQAQSEKIEHLNRRCETLESVANSGEKIDALTVVLTAHDASAKEWWGVIHTDLETLNTSVKGTPGE